jgi:molecular chaperone DnaJ
MRFRLFRSAPTPAPVTPWDIACAQLLGVPLGVDENALKNAYLRRARQYHPDHNPEGAARMKLLNEAYEHLRRRFARSA